MTFGLYVTYDKVAEEYSPVFQQKNDKVCLRVVHDLLLKSSIAPEDYQVFKIGSFDNDTGICVSFDHVSVCDDCSTLFNVSESKDIDPQLSLISEDDK